MWLMINHGSAYIFNINPSSAQILKMHNRNKDISKRVAKLAREFFFIKKQKLKKCHKLL
jgi:hypothetical protein